MPLLLNIIATELENGHIQDRNFFFSSQKENLSIMANQPSSVCISVKESLKISFKCC